MVRPLRGTVQVPFQCVPRFPAETSCLLIAIERGVIYRQSGRMEGTEQQFSAAERFIGGNDGAYAQPAVLIAPLDTELGPLLWGIAGQGTSIESLEQHGSPLPDCDGTLRAEAVSARTGCDPTLRQIGHALIIRRIGGDVGKGFCGGSGNEHKAEGEEKGEPAGTSENLPAAEAGSPAICRLRNIAVHKATSRLTFICQSDLPSQNNMGMDL